MSLKTFLRDFVRGLRGPLDCAEGRQRKALEKLLSSTNFGKRIHADSCEMPPLPPEDVIWERVQNMKPLAVVRPGRLGHNWMAAIGRDVRESEERKRDLMSRQATWIFVTDDPATWPSIGHRVLLWYGGDDWIGGEREDDDRGCWIGRPGVKAWMPVYVPEEE